MSEKRYFAFFKAMCGFGDPLLEFDDPNSGRDPCSQSYKKMFLVLGSSLLSLSVC